jgi:uncharacterized membrane protein
LKKSLTDTYGLFESTGEKRRYVIIGLGIVAFALSMILHLGWGWVLGSTLVIICALIFAGLMRRRSHAGVEAYEKVKGLQLYMKTAEADRLKMLQSVDRPYAEPSKTVDLFEKLLPFAVALGVEKSWAKQFEGIYDQAPSWYAGNFTAFNMGYLTGSLNSGISAMNTSFSAPTSSSSSGFGGGGFSGGGGGGGGGGGW